MVGKYLPIALLLLSCILSTAQTTSVLLNSASKSVARAKRAGSAVGKASGTVIKAGLTATRRSKKAADAVLAVGVQAGSVVAGASKKARRASQRTWEAARAAREAATAAYADAFAQEQQDIKQQAQDVAGAVFPAPTGTAAAADVAGSEKGECGLQDAGACSPTEAQPLPGPSNIDSTPPSPTAGHRPAADADHPGAAVQRKSARGLLLWTHLLALACGWMLHGWYSSSQQQQQLQPQKHIFGFGTRTGPAASSSGSSPARQQDSARANLQQQGARVNARSGNTAAAPAGEEQQPAAASSGAPQAVNAADPQAAAGTTPPADAAGASPPAAAAAAAPPPPPPAAAAAVEEIGDVSDDGSFVVCDGSEPGESSSSGIITHLTPRKHQGRVRHIRSAAGGFRVSAGTRTYGLHRRRQAHHPHERQQLVAAQQQQQQRQQLLAAGQHALGSGQAVHVVGQQTMIINHNHLVVSDEVGQLLLPVAKVLQEVGENLQHISHFARRWVGWTGQQESQQRLAAQQELLDRASHFGQLLGLGVMGVVALRAGRLWEVHQVCHSSLQRSTGVLGWAHRMSGTQTLLDGLQYINCCSQQLGLYAAGLFVLYMLLRASVSGSGACRRTATGRPSNAFQLDLIVVKGLVCSWLGAHVVHCLGGAWLPWLVGWLAWCATQLWLSLWEVNTIHSGLSVVLVALVLPLAIALGPFQSGAILLQGWVLEVFPVLNQLPSLGQLLLGA